MLLKITFFSPSFKTETSGHLWEETRAPSLLPYQLRLHFHLSSLFGQFFSLITILTLYYVLFSFYVHYYSSSSSSVYFILASDHSLIDQLCTLHFLKIKLIFYRFCTSYFTSILNRKWWPFINKKKRKRKNSDAQSRFNMFLSSLQRKSLEK